MAFRYEPELEAIIGGFDRPEPDPATLAARTFKEVREEQNFGLTMLNEMTPPVLGFSTTDYEATADDGATIRLRWYVKDGTESASAVLYLHGGGMIGGSVELYEPYIGMHVATIGVPMLAVDYRVAPEYPHPTPVEDCFTGLCWLRDHAEELAIDPDRIAVMGDSAGGGLAAGVALLARDRAVPLARQLLVYPMLDDQTSPDPELMALSGRAYGDNRIGWMSLLGDDYGTDAVASYASPAREQNLAGLAPAYIEVGEVDILRDESINYARRLALAGVSAELHVHAGAPHGYDRAAPDSGIARRAKADRARVLHSF